ncbi:thioredoxin-related transmembrane protein 1-like isoform X2 [Centruroides vittatus]|uniref:thioredoxin-related transmembrane protein 1-like isoform X2 n=1 Tax=Centruroides vittatus TaxID=120091 RepID=UPI00350FDE7D
MMNSKFLIFCCLLIFIAISSGLKDKERQKVIVIDDNNWNDVLENEWMLEFYAPWCPACKSLETTWEEFAASSKKLGINVGKSDVTTNPGLSGRFLITAFPTIFHIKNGVFRKYSGSRSKEAFISFIKEEKWNDIEPIQWWRSPSSIHMSAVSSFFKLALSIREYQDHLTEEHGIPQWASYVIFALGIIIIGTIIGIICVCVLDFVFRPKSPLPEYILPDETNNKKENTNEIKESKEEDVLDDESSLSESGSVRRRKVEESEKN